MQATSSGTSSLVTDAARRYTLGVLAVVYMFNFVDRLLPSILLPAIKAEFLVSDTLLGLLIGTAFALFYSFLGIPIALLADRWNRRNLIAIALAVWSGMTALSGLAANFWQLALARIGVGVGEAGCSPPAHSMISDLYPPERRSMAMGVYTLGISAGIMLAYIAGGWVVENIGWRQAFFIVGIPGIFLAVIVRFTVKEPPRGHSEDRADHGHHPPIREVFKLLLGSKAFTNMAVGAGLSSFAGYAAISWFPSFLNRSFEGNFVYIYIQLGLILGIAGGFAYLMGGYMADRIGRDRQRNAMLFIAATQFISIFASIGTYLSWSANMALLMFILPVVIANLYLPPVLAQTQSLVPLRMRGVASAIVLFVINLIGYALGPLTVGILSDYMAPTLGNESLRYALLIGVSVATAWAALHYFLASRYIEGDLERAKEG